MRFARRSALQAMGLGAAVGAGTLGMPALAGRAVHAACRPARGNPLLPGQGVCDPQVRVYGDTAYLYATHDASPASSDFAMYDWQIWSSQDLVDWKLAGTLMPAQTYFGRASSQCWATDAIHRDGLYYLYFSMGPRNIGVMVSDNPAGPWRDPLGKPLIAQGDVPTRSRDPGILQEADGTSYIVFGTFDFYIARLNPDMVSLAETPRLLKIEEPQGPYGRGRTDDKPFLHRRGESYYLSWGSYYAIGDSPYGPFRCKGPLLLPENVDAEFLDDSAGTRLDPLNRPHDWLNFDRHGSFFEFRGQWYFACNDQSQPGSSPFFRNSVISHVHYRANGEIYPLRLTRTGVGRYDAQRGIRACDWFEASGACVEDRDGRPGAVFRSGGHACYPKISALAAETTMVGIMSRPFERSGTLEIRRSGPDGALLGSVGAGDGGIAQGAFRVRLSSLRETDDLCLVLRGGEDASLALEKFVFV